MMNGRLSMPLRGFECTQEQWELLHEQLDRTRDKSTTVKCDIEALRCLLRDHAKLIHKLEGYGGGNLNG